MSAPQRSRDAPRQFGRGAVSAERSERCRTEADPYLIESASQLASFRDGGAGASVQCGSCAGGIVGAFYNAGIASGNTNTAAAIVSSNFAAGGGLSVRDRAMTVTGQGNVATAEGADGKPGNGTGADGQSGGDESNDSSSDGTSAGHGTTTSTTGRGTSAYRGVPQTGDAALDALLAVGALTAVSAGAVVLARSRMRRDNAK